jgi:site-specific DNA-methyltransferase (adenine-specific)
MSEQESAVLDLSTSSFHRCSDLELLSRIPSGSIDLILTDPPYLISKETGMQKMLDDGSSSDKWGTKYAYATDYGVWDHDFTLEHLGRVIHEFKRVLRNGGTCIIWFDLWKLESLKNLLEDAKFSKVRFIEWLKTNPVPVNSKATYLSNAREVALCAVKGGKATFHSSYDKGVYEYPIYAGSDRFHPTQKSLPLFQELIRKHSNEGDIVLDVYAGSATTHVAAIKEKRRAVSCEPDNDFFQKAITRIQEVQEAAIKPT